MLKFYRSLRTVMDLRPTDTRVVALVQPYFHHIRLVLGRCHLPVATSHYKDPIFQSNRVILPAGKDQILDSIEERCKAWTTTYNRIVAETNPGIG